MTIYVLIPKTESTVEEVLIETAAFTERGVWDRCRMLWGVNGANLIKTHKVVRLNTYLVGDS